jgi:hypothetical protein
MDGWRGWGKSNENLGHGKRKTTFPKQKQVWAKFENGGKQQVPTNRGDKKTAGKFY